MSTVDPTAPELRELAGYLDAERAAMMAAWRERVAQDPTLDAASDWTRKQLNDHFPDVLNSFGNALRAWPDVTPSLIDDEHEQAIAHARARWTQGYSLRGVMREWGHFNAVVVDRVAAFVPVRGGRAVVRNALAVWARLFNDQQALSALEYHRLEQAEAETRATELARTLEALRSGTQSRGRALEGLASTMRNDLQVVLTSNTMAREDDWHDAYQLRRLTQDSFQSIELALSNMVTLAHLEAGHESRRIERFDAAQGLALLADGLQHVAAQRGILLVADGPESLEVDGDAERTRRIALHLLSCAMAAPQPGPVTIRWARASGADTRWSLLIEHAIHGGEPSAAGRALAEATDAAQQVVGTAPTGEEAALKDGAIPVAPGDGVDLLIARHLCELLGGGFEVEAEAGRLRYRVSLPSQYPATR